MVRGPQLTHRRRLGPQYVREFSCVLPTLVPFYAYPTVDVPTAARRPLFPGPGLHAKLFTLHQSVDMQYMRFARGIIKDHSTPISALLKFVEDGHQRVSCPSDRTILLRSPILLRPKSLERDPVSHRERTTRVRTGYSRLATLACFQKNAGVNIAKRIEPMVAWSSARMEAVWGKVSALSGPRSGANARRNSPGSCGFGLPLRRYARF
jgi:hypothetical protein